MEEQEAADTAPGGSPLVGPYQTRNHQPVVRLKSQQETESTHVISSLGWHL